MIWLSYRRLSAGNDDDMRVIMMSRLACKCCCLAVFYPMVVRRRGARRCCCTLVFLYNGGEGVWARLSFIVHARVCHVCYLSIASHVDAFSCCLVIPFLWTCSFSTSAPLTTSTGHFLFN